MQKRVRGAVRGCPSLVGGRPAKSVALWAARVQIPHPALLSMYKKIEGRNHRGFLTSNLHAKEDFSNFIIFLIGLEVETWKTMRESKGLFLRDPDISYKPL